MPRVFVSVVCGEGDSKQIRQMDITDLSITQLIKLRKEQAKESHSKAIEGTIIVLDAIIREETGKLISPSNNISYIKQHKRNKKEAKAKKKIRRR